MPKHKRNPHPRGSAGILRPNLIAASVAACFAVSSASVLANPTDPTVVSGSASFSSAANALTVTNSNNAIINWQGFSIGVNEITRFVQPSSASAVLNRVTGAGGVIPQSVIDGVLASNGRVFLLNPSGIVIGATAQIDVAGMVASSLNLSNEDFLSGRLRFTEVPGAGAVVNNGAIETPSGGRVYLVAPSVENNGLIRSPQGEIVLAAGKEVELVSESSPFVTVRVTADAEQAVNLGQMISEAGRIGMFGALVRQAGVAQANSAVVGENGQIRLVATKDLNVEAGSTTTANGPSGGSVLLQAEGGTNLVAGRVEATGSAGKGGQVQALGLRVGVIGSGVIDASGETGGGTVLVGGDYQGANPEVQNAERTLIGPDGVIRADAWADEDTRFYGSISARGGTQGGNGGFVETSAQSLTAAGLVDTRAPNGTSGTWLLDPFDVHIVLGLAGTITAGLVGFDDPPTTGVTDIGVATIDQSLSYGSVTIQAHNDITLWNTDLALTNTGDFIARAGNNINLGSFNISIHGNLTLSANDAQTTAPGPSGVGAITSTAGFGNIATDGGSVDLSGMAVSVGAINTLNAGGTGNTVFATSIGPVTLGNVTSGGGSINIHGLSVATGNIDTQGPASGQMSSGVVNINTELGSGGIQTGSITTRSRFAYWQGGGVTLTTDAGNITVNGTIDTSGASGMAGQFDPCAPLASCPTDLVDGSGAGSISLSRTSTTVPGTISVTGNIVAVGGNGYADATSLAGGGGGGGYLNFTNNPAGSAYGDIFVAGSIDAHGGDSANAVAAGYGGGFGGFGGSVTFNAGNDVTVAGALGINAVGGRGGDGAAGQVSNTTPEQNLFVNAGLGGSGGGGGSVNITAGRNVSTASIDVSAGDGGAGADGAIATADASTSTGVWVYASATAGSGGDAGYTGSIYLTATAGSVTTGVLSANGGSGGAGGAGSAAYGTSSNGDAYATAGEGGIGTGGGYISIDGATGISTGAISVAGGSGGAGGANSFALAQASYGYGSATAQALAGLGGEGDGAGQVQMTSGGAVSIGIVIAHGGLGGAGGLNSTASADAVAGGGGTAFSGASAGSGGNAGVTYYGSALEIFAAGNIDTGNILAYGGTGGAAATTATVSATGTGSTVVATPTFPSGGSGGNGHGIGMQSTGGSITVAGSIDSSGGAGGAGGTAGAYGGSGGLGGEGTYFYLDRSFTDVDGVFHTSYMYTGVALAASGAVNVSNIYAYGGAGGVGGPGVGAYGGFGGAGGLGGLVHVDAGIYNIPGVLVASGGAGGVGGANGGSGGAGGDARWGNKFESWTDLAAVYHERYSDLASIAIQSPGGISPTALIANGGQGGNADLLGGSGGSGGAGGAGGGIQLNAATVSIGASGVSARGGDGGDGASGSATIPGGRGGAGGSTGDIGLQGGIRIDVLGTIDAGGGDGGNGGAFGGGGGAGGTAVLLTHYESTCDGVSPCTTPVITYLPDGIALGAGTINVAGLDSSGGAGGAGGAGNTAAYGGDGGFGGNAQDIALNSVTGISASGVVISAGGVGGAAGSAGSIGPGNAGVDGTDGALTAAETGGDIVLTNAGNRIPVVAGATTSGSVSIVNGVAGTLMQVQNVSGADLSFVSDQIIFSGPVSGSSVAYYTANDQPIAVTQTFFTNVTTPLMKIGQGTMTADISLIGAINLTSITNLSLITSGTIFQPTPATDSLTVTGLNADGGTVSLVGTSNSVTNLQGQARGVTGFFEFANLGAVNLATVDPGNAVAGVASAGAATISTTGAGGNITSSVGAGYAVQGTSVTLTSSLGAIGSAATPLPVYTASLAASADTGIYVDTVAASALPVTITQLQNLTSGDIVLNAWGGAQITTMVYNPNGNVFIYSHSPLDVLAGITAGQNIDLATLGTSSNDMLLDGAYTYGGGNDFKVTIGPFGTLTYGSSYSGVITILVTSSGDPYALPEVTQSVGSITSGTQRAEDAVTSTTQPEDEDEKKKREKEKKGATVCS